MNTDPGVASVFPRVVDNGVDRVSTSAESSQENIDIDGSATFDVEVLGSQEKNFQSRRSASLGYANARWLDDVSPRISAERDFDPASGEP